jgi:hypothetical protein
MRKKHLFALIAMCLAVYLALSALFVTTQNINSLLICADKGGYRIPFSKNICRVYLFNFRGNPNDIDSLHKGIGASFVVQGESAPQEREDVLRYLLEKNLNINNIGMNALTPLHEAVLANSVEEVEMLLRNGADRSRKDKKYALTPLELAVTLQDSSKNIDRREVIALLENFQQ